MKKNYIAPATELTDLASEGLMQPAITMNTVSGGTGTVGTTDDMDFIQ